MFWLEVKLVVCCGQNVVRCRTKCSTQTTWRW